MTGSPPLHRDLEELLRQLGEHRSPVFAIGPQERVDAHLVLLALGGDAPPAGGLGDFADHLAPVLARSPAERRAFDAVLGAMRRPAPGASPPPGGEPASPFVEPPAEPNWWKRLIDSRAKQFAWLGAVLLIAFVFALWRLSSKSPAPPQPAATVAVPSQAPSVPDVAPTIVPPPLPSAGDPLARLVYAADKHDGLPTLREVAARLGPTAPVRLAPDDYLRRLRALTGLPTDQPLLLGVPPGLPGRFRDDAHRLLWAISRIETPGRGGTFAELSARYPAAAIAGRLAAVDCVNHRQLKRGADVDDQTRRCDAALRAAADASDAPWLPQRPAAAAVPAWAGWLAAAVVVLAMAAALLPLLDPRRAFLRRRPPRASPERSRLLRQQSNAVLGSAATLAQTRKALQRREPRATRSLDVRATIRATIRSGGRMVPVVAATRSAPDYLVLVERAGVVDLEADRVAALIAPLRTSIIGVDLFWFTGDPSRVQPEKGGPAVPIEALIARFPNHRLLLMASGEQMLDLFSGKLRAGFAKLAHWRRRGLLTPVPRSEWAREEQLIGQRLAAPVARSTAGGLLALGQRLLDDTGGSGRLLAAGDDAAAALPRAAARLLRDPARLRAAEPAQIEELVTELSWYPDGPGFEWLCALAVYPAPTFDLTVYLGVNLPEWAGAPPDRRLYTPARLAALTRLVWLRQGRMPDAVRRALIARLSPERAAQVRALLLALIRGAQAEPRAALAAHATFARDRPAPDPTITRLLDDEVLVDFLRKGESGDLEVALSARDRPSLAERWRDLDWLALGAGALVLAYGIAAWFVTPGPDEGRVGFVGWLPLAATLGAVGVALGALRPVTVWTRGRRWLQRAAPFGLLLAVLSLAALPLVAAGGVVGTLPGPAWVVPVGLLGVASGLWLGSLQATSVLRRRLGSGGGAWALPNGGCARARLAAKAVVAAGAALLPVWMATRDPDYAIIHLVVLAGVGALVWLAGARLRPIRRSGVQPDLARLRALPRHWRVAPFAAGALLVAACLWFAWDTRAGHHRFAAPAAGERVVGVSADGLIAMTDGADGRTIVVVDSAMPGTELMRYRVPARPGEPGQSDPIASLAVGRSGGAVRVAAASVGGCVLTIEPRSRSGGWLPCSRDTSTIPVIPQLLALDGSGVLLRLGHLGNGTTTAIFDSHADQISEFVPVIVHTKAHPTAVAAVAPGVFVWSYGDGRFDAARYEPPTAVVGGKPTLTLGAVDRLPGGARIIRPLPSSSTEDARFLAVADDGRTVVGRIAPDGRLTVVRGKPIPALRVGPVIAWQEEAVPAAPVRTHIDKTSPSANRATKAGPRLPPPGGKAVKAPPTKAPEQSRAMTVGDIIRLSGSGTASAIADALEPRLSEAGLTTPQRQAAFLAVIARETGQFTRFVENMKYTATGLRSAWPQFFPSIAGAQAFAGDAEGIANRVYANKLGNGAEKSGDGYRFRGRGLILITGRANYARMGKLVGRDLVGQPDLLGTPDVAVSVALALWTDFDGNQFADSGDLAGLSRRTNGPAMAGFAELRQLYARYLAQLQGPPVPAKY